ncbi:aceE [Symbiodinium sp. CCMP2592]|nr:aceE [Symbiodinium sp. CCMP2592]
MAAAESDSSTAPPVVQDVLQKFAQYGFRSPWIGTLVIYASEELCLVKAGFRDDAADLSFGSHLMTESEAKQAYKALALKLHPDKCGCSEAFLRMKAAYDQRNDKKDEQRKRKGRPRNEAKRLAQTAKAARSAQRAEAKRLRETLSTRKKPWPGTWTISKYGQILLWAVKFFALRLDFQRRRNERAEPAVRKLSNTNFEDGQGSGIRRRSRSASVGEMSLTRGITWRIKESEIKAVEDRKSPKLVRPFMFKGAAELLRDDLGGNWEIYPQGLSDGLLKSLAFDMARAPKKPSKSKPKRKPLTCTKPLEALPMRTEQRAAAREAAQAEADELEAKLKARASVAHLEHPMLESLLPLPNVPMHPRQPTQPKPPPGPPPGRTRPGLILYKDQEDCSWADATSFYHEGSRRHGRSSEGWRNM